MQTFQAFSPTPDPNLSLVTVETMDALFQNSYTTKSSCEAQMGRLARTLIDHSDESMSPPKEDPT